MQLMTSKAWHMLPLPPPGFAEEVGLNQFQANLLYNRGITCSAEVKPFLNADSSLLNDPMLLPDMARAVTRLIKALQGGESIGVFGDFDADGVTGTALLVLALRDLAARVVPYLPHRNEEGHGLNDEAIRWLRDQGVSLLITVDCGATSVNEVEMAASLGIDTIITDHHTMLPTLPDACALINPRHPDSKYPYDGLTGVGMSYKLIEVLYNDMGIASPEHLMEMVALGTVADVGPLTGENRYMVKKGLEYINTTQNLGIRALAASARMRLGALDTESLSFGLIPRLNVAGRLDHAGVSLDLLTATSRDEAESLAARLETKNIERQMLTQKGFKEAQRQLDAEVKAVGVPPIIFVASENWTPGILGLIAARLSDHYYRPAIAINLGKDVSRASARSIPEFNVVEALRESDDLFTRFGGHPEAAGFTIPTRSLHVLERRMRDLAKEQLQDMDLVPKIDIECEISPVELAGENFAFIQSLSPFGQSNPTPVFLTRNARVTEARQVGGQGQHLKMKLLQGGQVWDAIAFRQGDKLDTANDGIDLAYTMGLNTWNGKTTVQLTIQDFRQAE